MKKASKDPDGSVAVLRFYQQLFVVAVFGSWLVETLVILHGPMHPYTNAGTWAFQATMWLYPILHFLLGLAFAAPRYAEWPERGFMAALLTVVGGVSIHLPTSSRRILVCELLHTESSVNG